MKTGSRNPIRQIRKARYGLMLLLVLLLPVASVPLSSVDATTPADAEFEPLWSRFDLPVADGETARTWTWGPDALSNLFEVQDESAPVVVQYFDKGRFETSVGAADQLGQSKRLVSEMIFGQPGSEPGQSFEPSRVPIAGDRDAGGGLTYADLGILTDLEPAPEGAMITALVQADGSVEDREELASFDVRAGPLIEESNHRVASVFWDFLESSNVVWDGSAFVEEPLFAVPLQATGFPLTEAYWTVVDLEGDERQVLAQCFERRCLTYTPSNPVGWHVEFNNAGEHHLAWRYADETSDEEPEAETELPAATIFSADGKTHVLTLEVAANPATRSCGLMHRDSLPDDTGMLFVWEQDNSGGFWNCNTFVPLTLAWLDGDGIILGFSQMEAQTRGQPQEVQTSPPPGPYRFVIEANQGWFGEQGIAEGDSVDLSEALARGDTGSDTLCQQLGFACN
jgi:uncharacterized membrane protein (UPF0127 family)